MPSATETPKTWIVVGSGNFGSSTAYELKKRYPDAIVILIDSRLPNPAAASHDINKIVRPDYAEKEYARIMQKAMKLWRENPLWSNFYHETGLIRLDSTDYNATCIDNLRQLGVDSPGKMISVGEMRLMCGGAFKDARFDGVDQAYLNEGAGWAEAAPALEAVIKQAIQEGVTPMEKTVKKLILDESNLCTGVELDDGESVFADTVVLCTGAETSVLLADSAPNNPEIQVGGRLKATGAVSIAVTVKKEYREKYRGAPVVKNGLGHTTGEILPLDRSGRLKANFEYSFSNKQWHAASGQYISARTGRKSEREWIQSEIPEFLKARSRRVMTNTYGIDASEILEESWRMCWDASTPSHHFLISPHSNVKNLYLATGGSFHGWKFLPVIGQYIVDMISGTLDPELADLWSWDNCIKLGEAAKANHTYSVKGELKDVETLTASISE